MAGAVTAYDPWDPAVMADPYPHYAELRSAGGCTELPDLEMWVLSTYELVSAALRDHRTFSSRGSVSRQAESDEQGRWIGADPPVHTATRALANPVFSKAALARHRAAVAADIGPIVDRFVEAGGGNVVTDLAGPVAVSALCHLLGVPNENAEAMTALSEATFIDISARSLSDGPTMTEEMQLAVGLPIDAVLEARTRGESADPPGDPSATMVDMVLAHAGEDVGFLKLNRYGRALYVSTLVSPGVETTRTMLTHAVELAARQPDTWTRLRRGEVSASAFIDECLRFESPIQGFFRAVTRDVEMGSTTIPAGARVLCSYGSANRDEAVFDQADQFRPARDGVRRHLAYGAGIHRCIGAWLAELEGVAAIEALSARVEGFEVRSGALRTDMAQLRTWQHLDVSVS